MPIWKKLILECLNALLNNRLAFWIYKRMGLFQAVFVVYPATRQYADHFSFRWRQKINEWTPWIIGVIKHPSGVRSLTFAISADEEKIKSEAQASGLNTLHETTKKLADKIGAKSIHYAGIIPGCMKYSQVSRPNTEQEATSITVVKAIQILRTQLGHPPNAPVILLGYKGFIGREVARKLAEENLSVTGVEKGDSLSVPDIPHLVVNITLPEVINIHVENFNEHSVLLNEVYPAPNRELLVRLRSKNVKTFHLAGVQAKAWPPFPSIYHGAVPCCGAIPSEHYEVALKKL